MNRDGENIQEAQITFPGDETPFAFGMLARGKKINLYLLAPQENRVDNESALLAFLSSVRDAYFPNQPLQSFDWKIRAASTVSDVEIEDGDRRSLKMRVSNRLVFFTPPAALAEYRADQFREFNPVRVLRIDPPEREETYFTQSRADGKRYFLHHGTNSSEKDCDVVYVDAQKFIGLLKKHSPEQAFSDAELEHLTANKLIGDWTGSPQPLMKMACHMSGGNLIFGITAGSSDLLASLQASGVDRFPVAVNKTEAGLLRQLCGVHQPAASSPGNAQRPPKPAF